MTERRQEQRRREERRQLGLRHILSSASNNLDEARHAAEKAGVNGYLWEELERLAFSIRTLRDAICDE